MLLSVSLALSSACSFNSRISLSTFTLTLFITDMCVLLYILLIYFSFLFVWYVTSGHTITQERERRRISNITTNRHEPFIICTLSAFFFFLSIMEMIHTVPDQQNLIDLINNSRQQSLRSFSTIYFIYLIIIKYFLIKYVVYCIYWFDYQRTNIFNQRLKK